MSLASQYPDPVSGWEPYRTLITRLYRDENKPLKEVMRILKTDHGFKATEKMYKSRIKLWNLDKKHKFDEVQEILRLRTQREALGKKSVFKLRGRGVDMNAIERYAKRRRLHIDAQQHLSTQASVLRSLTCVTPPPDPAPGDAERFLHSFDLFVADSLQSGHWRHINPMLGLRFMTSPEYYPNSARDRFFILTELGIRSHGSNDITKAYRFWRLAFSHLQAAVSARRPAQLIGLVRLVADLATCDNEAACLLLRYLGDLSGSHHRTPSDTRQAMLQCMSRLDSKVLRRLVEPSFECLRKVFCKHSQHFFKNPNCILEQFAKYAWLVTMKNDCNEGEGRESQ